MSKENYIIVIEAFLEILHTMTEFTCNSLKNHDNNNWWEKYVLNKLPEQTTRNLPAKGTYEELRDSLDMLACLNIIENNWIEIFQNKLNEWQRNNAHELRLNRNKRIAHLSPKTLLEYNENETKRVLDTISRFIRPINFDIAEKIDYKYKLITNDTQQKIEKYDTSQTTKQPKNSANNIIQPSRKILIKKTTSNEDDVLVIGESIKIYGVNVPLYKNNHETTQDFVKRLLKLLYNNDLLPEHEIKNMLNKDYCKETFDIQFPIIQNDSKKLKYEGHMRYWVNKIIGDYYVCSQWWKPKEDDYKEKISKWLTRIGKYYARQTAHNTR